jgi:putative addiction module killer protein
MTPLLDNPSPQRDMSDDRDPPNRDFRDLVPQVASHQAKARVQVRIDRLALGNSGDARPVGEGVSELRIDYGPGYRVYFVRRGDTLIVLLAGGDKRTQSQDIAAALKLARFL